LVDAARGLVHTLVNIKGWRDVALATRLEARVRRPVFVDNDVNVMALGEQRFGAGRGARNIVCLTLGTGLGGALILDGRLYRGVSGSAGELGHIVINPRGRRCGCKANGCLEAQVGTAAILASARQAIRQGSEPLRRMAAQAKGKLSPELVARAALAGDRAARRIWVDVGWWLGLGLSSLVNALNPERIIIGGGVANAWRLFAPYMMETLRAHALAVPRRAVHVVRARLAGEAGIIGAAVLVWDELGERCEVRGER
jgi:glucokinase